MGEGLYSFENDCGFPSEFSRFVRHGTFYSVEQNVCLVFHENFKS